MNQIFNILSKLIRKINFEKYDDIKNSRISIDQMVTKCKKLNTILIIMGKIAQCLVDFKFQKILSSPCFYVITKIRKTVSYFNLNIYRLSYLLIYRYNLITI